MILRRHPDNPILTRSAIPEIPPEVVDPTSVFNPGAIKVGDRIYLMLRVQTRGRETVLLMATSSDGARFDISASPVRFKGIETVKEMIYHIYDPRITCCDRIYLITFAADTDSGCRLGVARTDDFESFEFLGLGSEMDVRNGVLFPERFGDRYLRLDRPNRLSLEGGSTSGDEIYLSESRDLTTWKPIKPVMKGRPHFWDERIGSGPPPIKTREGWLHLYHGVATHFGSVNIYQAGVCLLDLEEPSRVLARSRRNILEPRESYELVGQVPNVVFPSGMVVEGEDAEGHAMNESRVLLYYGAADSCVALATSTVGELIRACHD